MKKLHDRLSTPIWALLCVWTVLCGALTLGCIGLLGQWRGRANGFQHTNNYLARELTVYQQQLRDTRAQLAATRTELASVKGRLDHSRHTARLTSEATSLRRY